MTNAVRQLIATFDALPEGEQKAVLAQLLKRLVDVEYPTLTEYELTQAAERIFLEYDRREATG